MSNPASQMGGGGCSELEPYALQVTGDSMVPEFWDGCIVIVEPGGAARHGSFVVVDYAGESIFRQLQMEGERHFLRPLNASYPVIELTGHYRIRGLVVQRSGRRRSQHKHYG